MADTVAWVLIIWPLVNVFFTRAWVAFLLWALDRLDRMFNPWTRERIRMHNEILAMYRREMAAKSERE